MNTIYSIVWNRALGEWTAVSELARMGGRQAPAKSGSAHALRHLALAIACVLGGTMACVPTVFAGTPQSTEHQQLQRVNPRLADLGDLMAKYGNAQPAVAKKVAPSTVAVTHEYPATVRRAVSLSASLPHASPAVYTISQGASRVAASSATHPQPVRVAMTSVSAPAPVPTRDRVVHPAAARVAATIPPTAQSPDTPSDRRIESPQLASDAQIAAVLAHRAQGQASGAVRGSRSAIGRDASTWVVDNDGSLHVAGVEPSAHARPAMASAGATAKTRLARVAHARTTPSPTTTLPVIALAPSSVDVAPRGGALKVHAHVATRLAALNGVQAEDPSRPAPSEPVPQPPIPDPHGGQRVAMLSATNAESRVSIQTSGLVLHTGSIHGQPMLAGTDSLRPDVRVTRVASSTGSEEATALPGDASIVPAMAAAPVRYQSTSVASTSDDFSTETVGSPYRFAPAAATPMALPPNDPRRPAPAETPPPGLIMGTGGLVGNIGGTLNPTLNSLLNPDDPYLSSGRLKLASVNITQTYQSLGIGSLGLVNLTPVGTLIDGTLMGHNQHLTLLGGVTSDSYITNINRGTDGFYPGLAGLLLPNGSPAWSDTCASLLGIPLAHCWAVNAAQNYQVVIGDEAMANGSEEVVIGTGASHKLPPVDANTVFPGDGRNDSTNPSGVPNADYEARLGHSVVIGDKASGTANGQTILGAEATSDQPNSVALGYKSKASRGPVSGYTDAYGLIGQAQNSVGEVSVGSDGKERQITHVAAGTDDHDAVNVAQLKGVVIKSTKGSVKYDSATQGGTTTIDYGSVTLAGKTSTDGGVTNGTTITNVHQGKLSKNSTDAVNGSQLFATNQNVTNNTTNITNNTKDITNNVTNINELKEDALQWNDTLGAYDASHGSKSPQKISNVAKGTADTDAVNVSQLHDAISTSGSVKYDSHGINGKVIIDYSRVTLAGPRSTDGGVTNGTTIANLHQGKLSADSTEAVNGSQLYATNQNVTNNTTNITKNTKDITKNVTNINKLKEDALQWNANLGAYDASHGTKSPQKISNVARGTADTDAVNVAQLQDAISDGSAGSVKYDSTTKNGKTTYDYSRVTLAGKTSKDGGVTDGTTISNLHQGALTALSTDAVNGSQLYATNSMLAKYMGGVTQYVGKTNTWVPPDFTVVGFDSNGNPTAGHYDNVTDAFLAVDESLKNINKRVKNIKPGGGQSKYFKANSTGAAADAAGKDSVAMGGNTVAKGAGSVAGGDGAQALSDGAVAIGQGATASDGRAVAIGPGAKASGDGAVSIGDPNVATGTGAVALGKDNTATGTGAVALGNTNKATGTGAVALGSQSEATADGSVAIGNGASSSVKGGVAIGTNSVADRANTVSVGSAGHERQITNVAAGTADTDAVNVAQLKASSKGTVRYDTNKDGSTNYNSVTLGKPGGGGGATTVHNVAAGKADTDAVNVAQLDKVKGWAKNYTDQRVNQFGRQLNNLGEHAYAGISSAMAMAGLPQAYLPGKNMAAIAGGTFHGESSLAIGVSMISDNGRWVFKISGSDNTQGDAGGAVGVGIQW